MRFENNQKNNYETIEIANKYRHEKIVAVDLAGAEALYPNEMFEDEIMKVNSYGLNLILHSGEARGAESVRSAIKYGAKRIGHGVHIYQDEEGMKILKDKGIFLEVCPKSNLDTKAFNKYEDLPMKVLKDHGVKVTINTDNMTVSSISVKEEYIALKEHGYQEEDLKEFALNSINATFADEKTKELLKTYIS